MSDINRIINVQLIIIICLIMAGVNVNYIFTTSINLEDRPSQPLSSPGSELEAVESSRARFSSFHWDSEQVVSEPVQGTNTNTGGSSLPEIVLDNGYTYLVWSDGSNTNGAGFDTDIFFKYYDSKQWSDVFIVSEPAQGQDNNKGSSYKPEIAVEDGDVYIVWQDSSNLYSSGTDYDIFYRQFNETGWSSISIVSEPSQGSNLNTGNSYNPGIDVENNNVHVVWDDPTQLNGAGPDVDIFYRMNKNGNWLNTNIVSEPVKGFDINQAGSYQPVIQVEENIVHIVWSDANQTNGAGTDPDIFYRYYNGVSWSGTEVVSEPSAGSDLNDDVSQWPNFAVDNGDVYVVWEDGSSIHQADYFDKEICYRHRTQSGWGGIEVVSEPVPGSDFNTEDTYSAKIDAENGSIYIVWTDENNTDGSSPNSGSPDEDVFYRWFDGDSRGWSEIKILSEPVPGQDVNKGVSEYPDISVWNRKVNVVWDDNNNTNGSGSDFDIFYRSTFVSPVLSGGNITPASGLTNTTFTYTVTYSDADNEFPASIQVNINGVDHPMEELNLSDPNTYDGKIYSYKTTLNISSTHTFRFIASDGSYQVQTGSFYDPVVYNSPPVIIPHDNLTITEDLFFEQHHSFTDIDHWQTHLWELDTSATSWLELDSSTGTISGTPTNADVGLFWVNLTLTDELDGGDNFNFTIEVINVNDAPVITNSDQYFAYEDALYEVHYQGLDIDVPGQTLTWNQSSNATEWLTFNYTETRLYGTPTNDEIGVYWVNISLSDGMEEDYTNFTLTVLNTNDPPVIVTKDDPAATATFLYSVHYEAYDIDPPPQNLRWNLSTNASSWLDINPSNGWLYGIPLKNHVGWFWVNVSVWDIELGFDFSNFTITVNPSPNKPPMINFTNVRVTAFTDREYSFNFSGSDDRTPINKLYWNITTNGSWLMIDHLTGNLTGTPSLTDVGWCWVNVTLHDAENESSFFNFTIHISIPWDEEKYPPRLRNGEVFPPMDDYDLYIFIVQYYDEDGDRPSMIEVVIDNVSHKMWFVAGDPANGEYEYHTDLDGGIYSYYFIAADDEFTVRTENYTLEVPGGEKESEPEDSSFAIILGVLVLIIVVIVVLFLILAKPQQLWGSGSTKKDEGEDKVVKDRPEPKKAKSKDDMIRDQMIIRKRTGDLKIRSKPLPVKKFEGSAPMAKPIPVKMIGSPIITKSALQMRCNVCLGKIKKGLQIVKCPCGKTYHRTCANRAYKCPNCGIKLQVSKTKFN